MSFFSLVTDLPGQIGDEPRRPKLITSANLATVSAAGYLQPSRLQGQVVLPTDIFDVWYGWTSEQTPGTYSPFTVSMTNGVITLVQSSTPGDVLLPVVSGHFANFNGTSGQIKDAGFLPSNAAKTNVVMANAATVIGNLVEATDIAGTIGDAGILATDVVSKSASNTMAAGSSIVLAKVNGTEAANAVTASGVAGVITTSSLTTAGGATYVITWTNTKITATSVIGLTIQGGTNNATNNITFTVVPGAGSATLTIFNNTAATALNGTLLIGYTVF